MVKLGEYVTATKAKNKDGSCTDVYSVTNSQGFVPSTEYFSKEVFSKELRAYKVVERGMIAYNPSRINVGSVALQDKIDRAIVSPLYVVFSVDVTRLLPAYVVKFLKSKPGLDQVEFRSTGTVRHNLKFEALSQMELDIPSLAIQEECLKKLGLVETQIALAEAYMTKLDELVKSRFIEMFGATPEQMLCKWDHAPLLSCVESIDSGKSVNCKAEPRNELEPGVLKLSALSSGAYLSSENKAMPDGCEVVPGKEVCFGDILVARKNTPELVGACVLVKEDTPNLMFPDLVFRMHPLESIDAIYLTALLGISPFSNSVRALAHGSAKSMSNIPKTDLGKLQVPLPPIELQCEFASFVAQVDKLEFAYQWDVIRSKKWR
ncbi:restriction endonuclease subunit S [Berryella wangjianweii]|uniref:Restriction endonuclease subunit S n=1 Tax=Berryella wangjianweii TaxID=2734634 RepID=A0A6M8J1X3_9ACTN|nr:restriction endonuclease subunit S [Berryella wangjianweii]QKF07547.1 restriction endonuclease subunit S [Berryella wangjianweii]